MASKTKTWTETGKDQMADVEGVAIFVADGTVGHYRHLGYEHVEEALDDYANGYKCDPQEITVSWSVFDNGEEVRSGQYTFNVE